MGMENRYDKYKDSGIAWIGEIPEHWDKNKIIRLFSIIGSGTTPKSSKEDNYIGSVNWIQSGDINGGYIENCKNTISDTAIKEYPALKIYKSPFIIVAMYGASVGNISISNIDGCVNQACCVMNETKQNFKYLFYAMNSVKRYLIYKAEGGGQPNISQDKIKNTWMPIPPFEEQQSIATYLDKKCGEIDELITLQEEMITKLQSYKQSVITEAVTKGLDKNVPLKNSGIEWIGEIPEYWEISKIKSHYNVILGKMVEKNNDSSTSGENYLCAANIKWNGIDTEINKKMYFSDVEKEKYLLQYNDVLIMEGGMAGTTCLYKNEFSPCYVQNSVNVCRAKKDFNNKILYYWMYVPYYKGYIDAICNKATIKHYTKEKVQNTPILVSPISEQQSIADYLDQKCSEIDELISIKQQKIEKLKDYKKSLIFECVTGKRKV